MEMNKKGSVHLTLENRVYIEQALKMGMSCKSIAENIDHDERTVSREVKKHRERITNTKYGTGDYKRKDNLPCKSLSRFPYVCNGCKTKSYCFKEFKFIYDAKRAQQQYELTLVDSRVGLDCSLEEKELLDETLKSGMDKGQSINHIVNTNPNIKYSRSSVYRLVNNNCTTVQRLDLRRAVKLKPRKHYLPKNNDNFSIREGRKYIDFIRAISTSANPIITEMDTVEAVRDGDHKCLLTLHITNTHFMLVYVMEHKSKECVSNVFRSLYNTLGKDLYSTVFNIVLTDRGSEFCDPIAIECDMNSGEKIANVYFCNSYSSYQKGAIEENHTLVRYVLPKGTLFDDLTQEKASLLASHVNSYYRESLDCSPYDPTVILLGKDFVDKLDILNISPELVNLTPSLIK